jgi:release factor glutamine methyltransferase
MNADAHGVTEGITFEQLDVFGPIESGVKTPLDLLVSNPPYVSASEWNELQPEVRLFEPQSAVSDREDGFKYYRRLAQIAPLLLRPNGAVVMEVGAGQAEQVEDLFKESGFAGLQVIPDLQEVPRVIVGIWRAGQEG